MDWLVHFVGSFFSILWEILKMGFDVFFSSLSTLLFFAFDGFLFVITTFISALDLSALAFNAFAEWSNLPPQSIYIINQLGLPQCAAMLGGAILLRMTLNIIPAEFTRL